MHPQRGFLSLFLVFIATIGIFGILSIITCHQIYAHSSSSEGGQPVSLIHPSKGGTIGISEGAICISKGANTLGFTTSLADVDTEQLNTQVHFDTDSLFFVCDNSTTGHICNDIRKFVPGSIRQTNKSLTIANGTGSCLQEGIVKIRLIDDMGTQHIFVLDNCLYHPESPVNLLSTRRLAEKFLDADENPDKETRIESRYLTHVLTWSFGQFKKTFPTPVSGLPELLFDAGFNAYKSFCSQVHSTYATNAVANSMTEPTNNSSHVTPSESQELLDDSFNDFDDDAINMLFMLHENVILKDGKGITLEVTYLGPQFSDEILQHKVHNKNGCKFLVDGTLLSSLNAPYISTIPVSVEQYANKLHKLTRE